MSRWRPRRFVLKLFDSLLTALSRPRPARRRDYLRILFSRSTRHFDRPAAGLSLLDAIAPGIARLWGRLVMRGARLPFRSAAMELLAHGSGTTVYSFGPPGERYVCKTQRDSLGGALPELIAFASDRLRKYRSVLDHYAPVAEVFPPTHFAIVHGPLLGLPVVVSVQGFVPGQTRDLLHDMDDLELERLLGRRSRLRHQVARFFECTIEAWEAGTEIVDLGRDNLLLVGRPGSERLVYLDAEMLGVAYLKARRRGSHYASVIERMKKILARLPAGERTSRRPPPELARVGAAGREAGADELVDERGSQLRRSEGSPRAESSGVDDPT